MDGTFVKEIAERVAVPAHTAGGLTIVPAGWTLHDEHAYVRPGPAAEALAVYSLGALREYVKANRDALDVSKLVVHVVSPQIVRLVGPIQERARTREVYVQATAQNLTDGFLGKFMAIDEFLVGLQTRFIVEEVAAAVLKLLGNVKHETVKTSADDGITQTVSAKAGVVLLADAVVPNPVVLVPYRTFREVTQPNSIFVLRVNQGRPGGLPEVGLFEADGGAWRLIALDRVHDWLTTELPDTVAVLA
jgi:hypothetical protein